MKKVETSFDALEVEQLLEQLKFFRDFADNSSDWESVISENGEFLYTSPSCFDITGYTPEEYYSDPELKFKIIHPNDLPKVKEHYQCRSEISEDETSFEYRVIARNGDEKWISHYCRRFRDKKTNKFIFRSSNRDITQKQIWENELRETQARLSLATQSADIGIWDYDLVDNVLIWDDNMYKLYGISPDDFEGVFEAWQSGIHPDDLEKASQEVADAISGDGEFHTTFRIVWPSGEVRNIQAHAKVLKDNGKAIKMIGVNWDITDQIQSEERIKTQNEKLSELNITKDKFFSIIAHDLKNPINAIMNFSEILLDSVKNNDFSDVEEITEYMLIASKQEMDLLTNLLDWSRSQSGKVKYDPETFKLEELVKEVSELLSWAANQKNIRTIQSIPPDLEIFADRNMLHTVIRNLISNAIKFTPDNGQINTIAYENLNELKFSIIDTGIGIKEECCSKLFRLDSHQTSKGTNQEQGTGLGLILCKDFIEAHQGKIWVESEFGKGSTFSFTIPLNKGD